MVPIPILKSKRNWTERDEEKITMAGKLGLQALESAQLNGARIFLASCIPLD